MCDSILIRNVMGKQHAILIQNAFPTLEKYIDHAHILSNGKPAKVVNMTCNEILESFKKMIKLKNKGINLFYTDIDRLKRLMEKEIKKD